MYSKDIAQRANVSLASAFAAHRWRTKYGSSVALERDSIVAKFNTAEPDAISGDEPA
jgi:hypothetical protein